MSTESPEGGEPAAPKAAEPADAAKPAEPADAAKPAEPADAAKAAEPAAPAAAKPAPAPVEAAKPAAAPTPAAAAPAAAKPAPKAAAAKPAAKPATKPAADDDDDDDDGGGDEPVLPKAPPWWRALRAEPPAHLRAAFGVGMVGLVLLVWWFVTRGIPEERIVSPSKIPSPGEVFGAIKELTQLKLLDSTLDTLERVFKGVGLAALVGVSIGVLASANRGVGAAMNPIVIFLRSVPMGALIPLTLLLFSPARQNTMFLFLALVGFVFSDTVKALMTVPERFVETAQTLGASRFQIVRKVLVPLALPDIITSLRFQFGLALGYVMLAEEMNAEYGLGKMINTSRRIGESEHVYLLIFHIALLAFLIDLILRTLQRGAFAWRKDL